MTDTIERLSAIERLARDVTNLEAAICELLDRSERDEYLDTGDALELLGASAALLHRIGGAP
ncbi:MAG: hypothetical protein KGL39_14645 [Patescibacteria group bacterium]|nr:hypothetical protein [Patescibacteria group bacterium]